MSYIKTFNQFKNTHTDDNFNLIFQVLYENHLSLNEKMIIESEYGLINESWFQDLKDKASRGVLKVQTKAGELLTDLAKKAKEILDFAKQIGGKIVEAIKPIIPLITNKVKNYALKSVGYNDFAKVLLKSFGKIKPEKFKETLKVCSDLVKYIFGGAMLTDMQTRIVQIFSKILETGTNEGLYYLDSEFLFEADEGDREEKKSFLQRLGEKINSYPPFSWIPTINDFMKSKLSIIVKNIDGFFHWLTTGIAELAKSRFFLAIAFIFQILFSYARYKVLKNSSAFVDWIGGAIDDFSEVVIGSEMDKPFQEIVQDTGFDLTEFANTAKDFVKKIPYIGDIISVVDVLLVGLGVYLSIEPIIKNIKYDDGEPTVQPG